MRMNQVFQNFTLLLTNLAWSLPTILAAVAGLVMVSIFRQRASAAANTAMWCLILLLMSVIGSSVVSSLLPVLAGNGGFDNMRLVLMVVNLGRQLINGAALLGLVYAVFQDRTEESDKLPQLEEWSDRRSL